jgi:integrase/recombinase XerC
MTPHNTVTSGPLGLVKHDRKGDRLAAARSWADLPADERKRQAAAAAGARDVEQLVDLTLAYQALKRRASDRTRETYAWSLRRLINAWAHVPILRATADDADMYRAELEQRYTVSTVRVHLAAASALYRALRWAGATDAAPWADVRPQKSETRQAHQRRDRFTDAEVGELLKHAAALPDRVLVMLGARAGLRLSELLNLRWVDVHTDASPPHVWVVGGKGGRDRRVLLVPEVVETLDALRRELVDGVHVLPWRSPSRTRQRLRNVADRAGVTLTPGKSVHSLRHACGTAVYGRTRDLLKVAQHLGHRNTSTSSVYVARAADDELYRDLLKVPPLPRLVVSPSSPVAV